MDAVQRLSSARTIESVQGIVRSAARQVVGADGATFVLRDDDRCFYADEDAIAPLWKGQRFPLQACISGWSMLHRQSVVIEDIYRDDRIPHDAYRPTFVKSLVMVPIRSLDPIGAIGTYWAQTREATETEVSVLQALADSTAVAMERIAVLDHLEESRLKHEEIYRQSITDDLTGLANRRGFLLLGEHGLEQVRRSGAPAVVFFIDVDGLKAVNDEHGHDTGDALLRRAAEALTRTFRSQDVTARIGGDEFAVLAMGPGLDPSDIIRRLRLALEDAGPGSGRAAVHASIGIASYRPGKDVETLLTEADAAMYLDKAARRELPALR